MKFHRPTIYDKNYRPHFQTFKVQRLPDDTRYLIYPYEVIHVDQYSEVIKTYTIEEFEKLKLHK